MGAVGGSLPSPLNSLQTPSEDPATPDQEVDHGATWRAPNMSLTRIDNMPLVHLRAWLTKIEPVSLTAENLRRLTKRGKSMDCRAVLFQIYEFVLGIDTDCQLFPDGRDAEALAHFVAELRRINNERGRRGQDLQLPPQWGLKRAGVYSVLRKEDGVYLQNRWTKNEVKLGKDVRGAARTLSDFKVEHNFSDQKAQVEGPNGERRYCVNLLSGECQMFSVMRRAMRRPLAVEDGTLLLETPPKPRRRTGSLSSTPRSSTSSEKSNGPRVPSETGLAEIAASGGKGDGDAQGEGVEEAGVKEEGVKEEGVEEEGVKNGGVEEGSVSEDGFQEKGVAEDGAKDVSESTFVPPDDEE